MGLWLKHGISQHEWLGCCSDVLCDLQKVTFNLLTSTLLPVRYDGWCKGTVLGFWRQVSLLKIPSKDHELQSSSGQNVSFCANSIQ